MRLFIAEKPGLGRAIAAGLARLDPQSGPTQKGQGWLRCGPTDYVSWCIGHLLEPAEPAQYEARWQQWRLADLPMIPERWTMKPRDSVAQQLKVLESLIRKAEVIVHAGDPDREGQLLVDEVLRFYNVSVPVERLLINDLTPSAVAKALESTRDNRQFRRLSHSALARQRADWLYGMNLTRAYTLHQRQTQAPSKPRGKGTPRGQKSVYSVGRVQTPVLGLVVERDATIADFTPQAFYSLQITGAPQSEPAATFMARWRPDERFNEALDEENRILDRAVVERVAAAIDQKKGQITASRFRDRNEQPPLPLSLSVLQIEAGRLYTMGAKAVLDVAQSLYEKHQLITYPRSDCRYLPTAHYAQRLSVIRAIASVAPSLAESAPEDPSRYSRAWNDDKVDAHHGIIPTGRSRPASALSEPEQQIYGLIARYYLMQFCPDAIHREGRLDLDIAGYIFRATESGIAEAGWKALELHRQERKQEPARAPLPRLPVGAAVTGADPVIRDRLTQPPQFFTDATLLSAMTNIARFVADRDLRKTLRETDGLGTEATRAGILETLFQRDYLRRDGRFIKASDKGHGLISVLPDSVAKPDMTAVWESTLEQIRGGDGDPRTFLKNVEDQVSELVGALKQGEYTPPASAENAQTIHCPQCRSLMRERDGKHGRFWSCARYPDCTATRSLEDAANPTDGAEQAPVPCPACFSPMVRRQGNRGAFWGCSNYPGCRQTLNDQDGKPVKPA
jgi:DNA topoisomerase-3